VKEGLLFAKITEVIKNRTFPYDVMPNLFRHLLGKGRDPETSSG
jgi:hypothetical protein